LLGERCRSAPLSLERADVIEVGLAALLCVAIVLLLLDALCSV
jgi:hypothetical protein